MKRGLGRKNRLQKENKTKDKIIALVNIESLRVGIDY